MAKKPTKADDNEPEVETADEAPSEPTKRSLLTPKEQEEDF